MGFNAKLRISLSAVMVLGAGAAAQAGPDVCVVSVRQLLEKPDANRYALTCLESNNACSGFATLTIDGKEQTVAVEAKCVPGSVELTFWTVPEQQDLLANNQPSLYVATGVSGTVREQLVLTPSSEKVGDVQGLLWRPVIRGSTPPLATIEVEITPKRAD